MGIQDSFESGTFPHVVIESEMDCDGISISPNGTPIYMLRTLPARSRTMRIVRSLEGTVEVASVELNHHRACPPLTYLAAVRGPRVSPLDPG